MRKTASKQVYVAIFVGVLFALFVLWNSRIATHNNDAQLLARLQNELDMELEGNYVDEEKEDDHKVDCMNIIKQDKLQNIDEELEAIEEAEENRKSKEEEEEEKEEGKVQDEKDDDDKDSEEEKEEENLKENVKVEEDIEDIIARTSWKFKANRNHTDTVKHETLCEFKNISSEEISLEKRKGYVITLPYEIENRDGLPGFLRTWHEAYPELSIEPIYSSFTDRRGLGIIFAAIYAIDQAIKDDVDIAFFFEDDAIPHKDTQWPRDLDRLLENWNNDPDSVIMFLGGHRIIARGEPDYNLGITKVIQLYGAFGYAVRKHHLPCLAAIYRHHILKQRDTYDIDRFLWCKKNGLQRENSGHNAYIATPLLVDHQSGFSNTWGYNKKRKFEGVARWEDVKGINKFNYEVGTPRSNCPKDGMIVESAAKAEEKPVEKKPTEEKTTEVKVDKSTDEEEVHIEEGEEEQNTKDDDEKDEDGEDEVGEDNEEKAENDEQEKSEDDDEENSEADDEEKIEAEEDDDDEKAKDDDYEKAETGDEENSEIENEENAEAEAFPDNDDDDSGEDENTKNNDEESFEEDEEDNIEANDR